MRSISVAFLLVVTIGCGSVQEGDDIDASLFDAAQDVDAPPGTDANLDGGLSCTPSEFVECADAQTARFCNAAGTAVENQACGAPGCNAVQQRCNICVPDSSSCESGVAKSCGSDGLPAAEQTCQLACIDANGGTPAHCQYLQPRYLPDVCDQLATDAQLTVDTSVTLDTGAAATCNGGIVVQSGGPQICIMRYGSFQVNSGRTLTVIGNRALAIVTDGALNVAGMIDVAAAAGTSGPGGGTIISGTTTVNSVNGGGGAGFRQNGGMGGGGTAGGGTLDPLNVSALIGGPRPGCTNPLVLCPTSGGGGGAMTLISCRGTVNVSGVIDAGGGGGRGGFDQVAGPQLQFVGASGGGAGGQVVIQGLGVSLTGELFANGGGGGGGSATNDTAGGAGGDGTRSETSGGTGGSPAGAAGAGGRGGFAAGTPGNGTTGTSGSHGGGGGSMGYFWVYVPSGVTPTLTPGRASPPLSPTQTAPTR